MTLIPVTTTMERFADYEQFLDTGVQIREAAESLQFMLGDWVNAGTEQFEESQRSLAADMSRVTGVAASTLRSYAVTAKAFPASVGRPTTALSYSHYERAATADNPLAVLQQAEAEGLSVRDTARLAKGLPIGGEAEAQQESSHVPANVSLEESALGYLDAAVTALLTAESILGKQGFRLTVPVGTKIMARLAAAAKPFQSIEAAVEDEVGHLL